MKYSIGQCQLLHTSLEFLGRRDYYYHECCCRSCLRLSSIGGNVLPTGDDVKWRQTAGTTFSCLTLYSVISAPFLVKSQNTPFSLNCFTSLNTILSVALLFFDFPVH